MCKRCTYMNIWSVITQAMGNGGGGAKPCEFIYIFTTHALCIFHV